MNPSPGQTTDGLVYVFCSSCSRTTYVRFGTDLTCPVCTSLLVEIDPTTEEPQAT